MARLFRAHWLEGADAACTIGLSLEAAAERLAALEAAAAASGGQPSGGGDGGGSDSDASDGDDEGGAAAGAQGATPALCAEARIAELEAAAAGEEEEGGSGGGARGELHRRLFALLLRYKSMQGAGFQASAKLGF